MSSIDSFLNFKALIIQFIKYKQSIDLIGVSDYRVEFFSNFFWVALSGNLKEDFECI